MKVIVSTPNWVISGVNSFNLNLLRGIQEAGHTVELLIIEQETPESGRLPIPTDIPVKYLKFDGKRSWWTSRWQALESYLNAVGPCVYLPGYDFQNASIVPALNDDVIVAGVVHSDEDVHYEHLIRMGRYWNAVITVSRHLQARALEIEPAVAARCFMVSYGVSCLPALTPRQSDRPLRIVYSGRFVEQQKRVSDLPRIAAALDRHGVQAEWLLIGDGPEEPALRAGFAALIERGAATFTGRLTNDSVLRHFAEAEILVLTSDYEGLPVAMLEGMGQGLIPVVTRIESGVGDLIRQGENGFTVPIGDIEGFAETIAALAGDPSRRAGLRDAAHQTISSGPYAIGHVVRRYLEIFEDARRAVTENRFRRPKSYRPGSWTGAYVVPPELQIAPDVYYDLKYLAESQAKRIQALEAQAELAARQIRVERKPWLAAGIPLWKRVWRVFYWLGRRLRG